MSPNFLQLTGQNLPNEHALCDMCEGTNFKGPDPSGPSVTFYLWQYDCLAITKNTIANYELIKPSKKFSTTTVQIINQSSKRELEARQV